MKKALGRLGFSFEILKKTYDIDISFGGYITSDAKVYIGFVIYFYKWCIGFWLARPENIKFVFDSTAQIGDEKEK